jgi:hypothetical protein
MHWAAAMGDVEVMKELTKFGCSPTHPEHVRGETPLMRVCTVHQLHGQADDALRRQGADQHCRLR